MKLQAFSELDIKIVAKEIKEYLANQKVKSVFGTSDGCFVLEFSKVRKALKICPLPHAPRLHLVDVDSVERDALHKFANLLVGFTLRGIKIKQGDRVIYFRFTKQISERILAVELTGKYANACVIDAQSREILAVAFERRSRRLSVGRPYEPLESKGRSIFDHDVASDYAKLALPHFYDEVLNRYGKFEPSAFHELLEQALSSTEPVLYFDEDGTPVRFSPIPLKHLEHLNRCDFETYSDAVATYFELKTQSQAQVDEVERIRQRLLQEMQRLADFEKYRRWGELILSNLNDLRQIDAETIEIHGEIIKIQPDETPKEAAARFFKLFKKSKRGLEKLKKRLEELEHVRPKARKQTLRTPQHAERPSKPYLEFLSPNGFKVFVGRNARGNEVVTFGLAKPHDLFFHAKDVPGAHVVLRRQKGADVPDEDIEFAAKLALRHSKAARDGKGLVSMTERRFVQKLKGAPIGTVKILRENVLQVRLDGD